MSRNWQFILQLFLFSYTVACGYIGWFYWKGRGRNGDHVMMLTGLTFVCFMLHGIGELISGGWGYVRTPIYSDGQAITLWIARTVRFSASTALALYLLNAPVKRPDGAE